MWNWKLVRVFQTLGSLEVRCSCVPLAISLFLKTLCLYDRAPVENNEGYFIIIILLFCFLGRSFFFKYCVFFLSGVIDGYNSGMSLLRRVCEELGEPVASIRGSLDRSFRIRDYRNRDRIDCVRMVREQRWLPCRRIRRTRVVLRRYHRREANRSGMLGLRMLEETVATVTRHRGKTRSRRLRELRRVIRTKVIRRDLRRVRVPRPKSLRDRSNRVHRNCSMNCCNFRYSKMHHWNHSNHSNLGDRDNPKYCRDHRDKVHPKDRLPRARRPRRF